MIRELIVQSYNGYRQLFADGCIPALVFAFAVYALIIKKDDEKSILSLVLSPIGACAVLISGLFESVCKKNFSRKAIRVCAALFAAALCILAVVSSGKYVFSKDYCEKAGNDMHIPQDLLDAMSSINADGRDVNILVPPGWEPYFESYSSFFNISQKRDDSVLLLEFSKKSPDMRKIAATAKKQGAVYVVLPDDIWPEEPITKWGYELFKDCGTCIVYREVSIP